MIEGFQPADYVWCALTIIMAVLGLFRGFSGTLGFALALVVAVISASICWEFSTSVFPETWMRAAATLVAVLLIFGLVRILVRKLVNGLLAQPSDALFGLVIGAALGVLVLIIWAKSGVGVEYSTLASNAATYFK